jgi:hypothetical protein
MTSGAALLQALLGEICRRAAREQGSLLPLVAKMHPRKKNLPFDYCVVTLALRVDWGVGALHHPCA